MKKIFENDFIKVNTTANDSDFIAVIENKTNQKICVHYDEPGYNDHYDPILIQPNSWVGVEGKCYLAQLHTAKMTLLEAEELRKTTKVVTEIHKTRKYDRKGVAQRLLTNAAKRVVAYSQELAIDDASVFVELGDYASAYRVLKRNGLNEEAEALKKAIKGGD